MIPEQSMAIWRLCQDCAAGIYGKKAPSERYANDVARLLLGTACQESGLEWRRQRSPDWKGSVGGFGLWQVEYNMSVMPSMEYLREHPAVAKRATRWLWQDPHAVGAWVNVEKDTMLWMLRGWDRLGCLMARLHYMCKPEPVPTDLVSQAAYWKFLFNSSAGKGTEAEYMKNWHKLAEPLIAAGVGAKGDG